MTEINQNRTWGALEEDIPGDDNFMRADWGGKRVGFFDLFIRQHGYITNLWKGHLCPCIVPPEAGGTGQPDLACLDCKGTGRYYPDDPVETRTWASGQQGGQENGRPIGPMRIGTASLTVQSGVDLDYADRVQFTEAHARVSHTVMVSASKANSYLPHPIVDTISAYYHDPTTHRAVAMVIGTHYELVQREPYGLISWLTAMPASRVVSLRYWTAPYFYVVDLPNIYRGTEIKIGVPQSIWTKLPQRAIIRRADLMAI